MKLVGTYGNYISKYPVISENMAPILAQKVLLNRSYSIILLIKTFWAKKILVTKNVGKKKFLLKKNWSKRLLIEKKFWSQKNCQKNFLLKKFKSKKVVGKKF